MISQTRQPKTLEVECFRDPGAEYSVVYTWAWNAPVTKEKIRSEIDRMKEAGILSFYILPLPKVFRSNTMVTEMEPDYMTDAFVAYTEYAITYAASLGMVSWLYDEGGWPSGSASDLVVKKHPTLGRKVLEKRCVSVGAGVLYVPSEDTVASFIGKTRILEGETFSEKTEVTEYYITAPSPQFADIYDPVAARTFVHLTHEKYKEKMSEGLALVPYMFTDEPCGRANSISPYILERFKDVYGYALEDYIYVLLETKTLTEREYRVRCDYAGLLCEMMRASLAAFREASHACGLDLVGHLDNDHLAKGSVINGYGNFLACLKELDIPGIDAILGHIRSKGNELGEGCGFFPRMASSAAYQNGTTLALTESCSVYGNSLSPDEIRYILGYQLVRGINIFNLMLMPFSVEKWYGYGQRPFFHHALPGYRALGELNRQMARASYFMSVGTPTLRSALYFPCEEFWREDARALAAMGAYKALGETLEDDCIDFDIIDRETILSSTVQNGVLHSGVASYARIYIPDGIEPDEAVKAKLAMLSDHVPNYVDTDNKAIKSKVNRDEKGNLYICLFNQSDTEQRASIYIHSAQNLYLFDAQSGEASPFVNGAEYSFAYGQCLFIYATEDTVKAREMRFGAPITPTPCGMQRVRAFRTPKEGIEYASVCEGNVAQSSFAAAYGEAFSGEVCYHYTFDTDAKNDLLLAIEGLQYSASVFVGALQVGDIATAPYRLRISKEYLVNGENVLDIYVENTAANGYNHTPITEYYAQKYLGPYNAPSQRFESEMGGGGICGEVKLIPILS